ncbi:FdhF/YdeP family oxidoreductase [Propionibacteriaceae bacterium Y1923]
MEESLKVGRPQQSAAGIPGVVHALGFAVRERALLPLLKVNQTDGFDCPGCAWPDPDHRHVAEFCENGAKAVAEETTARRCGPEFFAEHDLADLRGRTDHWLGRQGRLTTPMYRRRGASHYEPVSWEFALDLVAAKLSSIEADEAVFYTSGRTSNEAAFLYQLLVRRLGTNNLPDCSNMCHESSGSALTETIGIGKGTVTLTDVETTDLILINGQNPGTNHPRMLSALEKVKARGGRIIAINPLPEAGLINFKNPQTIKSVTGGVPLADEFCQIRVNGDLALFRALNRILLDRDAVDHEFIETYCTGFEEYVAALEVDRAETEFATGLEWSQIERVADLVCAADTAVVCWAMGLTQHKNSVPTIKEIVNFLLLRGNMGKPGAGACPVRGHSNVQGDRTVGINEKPPRAFIESLSKAFDFEAPTEHGYDVVDAIRAMREGRVKFFMGMGGNFVRATPDTEVTEQALGNLELTVQVSTKLNGSHAVTGAEALILPTLGRTDADPQATGPQDVTVEDSMGMVHASRGRREFGGVLSEVAIVTELGRRLFADAYWDRFRGDYSLIRDKIEEVIPGFEDYNERIRHPGGFALPNGPRERRFTTASGRAHFTVNPLTVVRTPLGHLILQTVRSHDQYNTTVYGLDDRYRGIKGGRRVVFVHPDDLAELGIADGSHVTLVSMHESGERRAAGFRVVAYDTARGCAAAYFPETNVLVPLDSVADTSQTPTSKSIIVRLEPEAG